MKSYSLKARIILITLIISLIVPLVSYFIIYRNNQTAAIYQNIANETLNRMETSGEMLSNFRQIRVEVRSLGLLENTKEDAEKYVADTVKAIGEFEKSKTKLEKLLLTEAEKEKFRQMDAEWKKFFEFGKSLLQLAKNGDTDSFRKLAHEVRVTCPLKKESVEKHIREFIEVEKAESIKLVSMAKASATETSLYAIFGTIVGAVAAIVIGLLFATKVSKALEMSILSMLEAINELKQKSNETSDVSEKISNSSVQQASSLQQTVASVDEISAMVSRNADSAASAAMSSEDTNQSVVDGKTKVEDMLASIRNIAEGNEQVIHQMQHSNKEISDIVLVIEEISQKTQVINDIVFQTKLLSFNASVEAARAGEHGKGFAVVAEEVGNLASMSGKAANEISALLNKSVTRVAEIVENSRTIMNGVVENSKIKVDNGTKTAHECAEALDHISAKISTMSEMVKEISVASSEQSSGIREINKAMSNLDQMTRMNTEVAKTASTTASDLQLEAEKLDAIVLQLTRLVRGSKGPITASDQTAKSA